MAKAQALGEIADRRRAGRGKAADCQQRLVLAGGEAGTTRRGLAEFEKLPQQVAKIGKRAIAGVIQRRQWIQIANSAWCWRGVRPARRAAAWLNSRNCRNK